MAPGEDPRAPGGGPVVDCVDLGLTSVDSEVYLRLTGGDSGGCVVCVLWGAGRAARVRGRVPAGHAGDRQPGLHVLH